MKIFFSHDNAIPLFDGGVGERFGGAEMQIHAIASTLARYDDFQVNFIVKEESIKIPKVNNVNFVRFPKLISRGLPGISRIINERRLISRFGDCSNGIFLHTIADANLFQNFIYANTLGLKFALRLSCNADVTGDFYSEDSRRKYLEILSRTDLVVAQSIEQSEALYELARKKSVVIRNGFPDIEASKSSQRKDGVLWIGRCVSLKQPWNYLEIARRIPNERFLMILGKDDLQLAKWIKDSASSIQNLEIREAVPNCEVQRLLRRSKLLVGTSAIEGFPNVYCEAMRAGTPIASLSVDPDGMIEHNNLGIVAGNNMEKFVEDIRNLLNSEEILKLQSINSRGCFEKNFLIENVVEEYHRELNGVLK